jgi:hypothetical protein
VGSIACAQLKEFAQMASTKPIAATAKRNQSNIQNTVKVRFRRNTFLPSARQYQGRSTKSFTSGSASYQVSEGQVQTNQEKSHRKDPHEHRRMGPLPQPLTA